MNRLKAMWGRLQQTTALKAWKRYGDAHGNILAGGVGYFAFFSIFPAVALAFTVFGIVLRGHPDLIVTITDALNRNLPGFVKDARHPNGIISITAPGAGALTVAGIVSVVSLVLSGLGWLSSLRESIRAIFGFDVFPGNVVTSKVRDLGVLLTLGLGIALSAILTSAVGSAASWIGSHVGLGGNGWVVTLAGLAVGVIVDTALMLLLLRVLTGIAAPSRVMLRGALVGGIGFTVIKLLGSALIGRASHNALFASVAIVVGLLFWLNLISRLTLLAAAWAANDVDAARLAESPLDAGRLRDSPVEASSVSPGAASTSAVGAAGMGTGGASDVAIPPALRPRIGPRAAAVPPSFGRRAADRVTLGAGAVLGATVAVGVGAAMRGLRSVARFAGRRSP